MGFGDTLSAAWNIATAPERAAAAAIVTGAKATAHAAVKAANWVAAKEVQAAHAVVAAEKKVVNATTKAAVATYKGAKWLAQGVGESFTGGPKGFVCIPCKILAAEKKLESFNKAAFYNREYSDVQGTQLRICTGADGNQTIEVVTRKPDGSYQAIGTVKPLEYNADKSPKSPRWEMTKVTPYDVPTPNVSHVNGISNTPAEGLSGATELQLQLKNNCAGRSPAKAPCPGCDCVLYTYSETLGVASDLVQCLAGKLGWNGKVSDEESQMMRDAIKNDGHITMSAHSRGSILTEDSWNTVFDEQSDKHLSDPDVQATGDQAYKDTLEASGDPLSAGVAGQVASRQAANDKAGADMNEHVTVVSSGNAVSFYNPQEQGVRVVSTRNGWPVDVVNVTTGSRDAGQMRTVRNEIPPTDSLIGAHHNFNQYYAEQVAKQICGGASGSAPTGSR